MNDESDPSTWGQCSGHCCRAFLVDGGKGPDELMPKDDDDDQIIGMLVPLGQFKENPSGPLIYPQDSLGYGWYYTCKHHCESSGRCLDYDNRPKMCRKYPRGRCDFLNCTRVSDMPTLFGRAHGDPEPDPDLDKTISWLGW